LDKLASRCGIPVQRQETCSNRKDSIQVKLWKIPLERGPHGSNGHSMSRRFPHWVTKKLETDDQSNGRSIKEYEEAVRQEKEEPSRIEGWRQHVAREQEYPFKSTLKEAGQQEIWTF